MTEIITTKREELEELIRDVVSSSHLAIDKTRSNDHGEIKTAIKLIQQDLAHIKEDNTRRNGSFVKAVESFTQKIEEQGKAITRLQIDGAREGGIFSRFSTLTSTIVSSGIALVGVWLTTHK